MYYYNPYFVLSPMPGNDEMRKDELVRPTIFKGDEGYIKGNIFAKEYRPYKNYQPGRLVPTNEREALLLDMMTSRALAHDLGLYLDVKKDDKDLLAMFNKYNEEYKKVLDNYVKKYGPLSPAMVDSKEFFTYVTTPTPWLL